MKQLGSRSIASPEQLAEHLLDYSTDVLDQVGCLGPKAQMIDAWSAGLNRDEGSTIFGI